MAVTDQDPRNPYTGNGIATTFAYTFKIFEDSDLKVEVDGVIKTLNTDYIVTGAGDSGGGNVVFVSAPASGTEVLLYRDLPYDRETDYSEDLLSAIVNNDFDKAIMLIQQDRRDRIRAIKVPMSETEDQVIDDAAIRAGGVLGFNDATGAIETKFIADMGVVEAGDGLQLSGEVLSVKTGDGLKIDAGAVAVDPTKALMLSGGSMSGALNEAQDTIAAHATTCDIWSKPNNVVLSGDVVTFTDLADAPQAGAVRWVKSNAAHILTNNANLIVQSGADVTLAAGDWIKVEAITTTTFNLLVFRADGTAVVGGAVAGQIIQVVSASLTGTFTSASASFVDITSLSVAITPSSASSKILVMASWNVGQTGLSAMVTFWRFTRDGTAIGVGEEAGNRRRCGLGACEAGHHNSVTSMSMHYQDSPASTSELTYKLQGAKEAAGTTFQINYPESNVDSADIGTRNISTITVMEVKG